MRDFKGMKRQRGRNRGGGGQGGGKPQHNINRAFDSNGPDNIKVRGNAQHVYEKYQALARDATLSGDRVLAENHLQHAEHYFRTLRAIQPTRAASEIVSRDTSSNGDIDFEDEAVETAMEEADAQAAARAADAQNQPPSAEGEAQATGGETPRFDQGQGQNQGQRREWRDRNDRQDRGDRPQGEFRDRGFNDRGDRQDRPQGEYRQDRQGQGGGEFRDRQDRGDRPRFRDRDDRYRQDRDAQGGERQDRVQGEFRPQGSAQGQGEFRDRQDRGDRPRFRERDERRYEPVEGASLAPPSIASTEPFRAEPAASRDEAAPVLRSEDGGVSQLPGFLQAPGVDAPGALEDGERARRPRRRRTRDDGDAASTPQPEVEEV